jgi:hypothetical protein
MEYASSMDINYRLSSCSDGRDGFNKHSAIVQILSHDPVFDKSNRRVLSLP